MNDKIREFVELKLKTLTDDLAEDIKRTEDRFLGRFMEGRVSAEECLLDIFSEFLKIEDDEKAKSFMEEKKIFLMNDFNDDKAKKNDPIEGRYYSGRLAVEEHSIEILDEIIGMFK